MKQLIQPASCCSQLAVLSKKHSDLMLFVWKIKQGMKLRVNEERIARYCSWFWEQQLRPHFENEKAELIAILSAEHPMIIKVLDDYEAIEMKFRELLAFPSYYGFHRLGKIISYHVLYAETQLLPLIENVATKEQLNALLDHTVATNRSPLQWKDEFWVRDHTN